jgi:hypothetical protein
MNLWMWICEQACQTLDIGLFLTKNDGPPVIDLTESDNFRAPVSPWFARGRGDKESFYRVVQCSYGRKCRINDAELK